MNEQTVKEASFVLPLMAGKLAVTYSFKHAAIHPFGGAAEPQDDCPRCTALRELKEEAQVDEIGHLIYLGTAKQEHEGEIWEETYYTMNLKPDASLTNLEPEKFSTFWVSPSRIRGQGTGAMQSALALLAFRPNE